MKTVIFDLETFNLSADTGIILCCSYKTYGSAEPPTTIRADSFPQWKRERSNSRPICKAVIEALYDYDIFVAHNGMRFDRGMLISFAIRYDLRLFLRFAKFIDPVQQSRRFLRLSRNNLSSLAAFLRIEEEKTPIDWDMWRKAAYDGSRDAMNYIVHHCEQDVVVLDHVHDKMRKLVRDINEKGSYF